MNSKLSIWGFVLILSALIVSGCGQPTGDAGLANPAAVYCQEQGYTLEMRTDADGGIHGVCIFPDGSECEEWAFFRGECSPGAGGEQPTPPERANVNVVEQVGLADTVGIEILESDADSPSSYNHLLTITDSQVVVQIIAALDMDLQLGPRARCPAWYTLRFHLGDGTVQEFGYACDPDNPSFLRGGQGFWQNQDVEPPAQFNELLQEQLASAPTEVAVVGWLGHVVSLPDGSQFDDYLVLAQGVGEVGLTGADAGVEAEIVALRDKEEPGKYAHFWGALTCPAHDYDDCQLVVTRLDPGTPPGPRFDPDPVEGWEGQVFSVPGLAQFDDYFVLDSAFPVQYGIQGADEALQAQLEDLRDTSATIRIWGEIQCAIPDYSGCSIGVERWELVSEESPPLGVHFESPVVGWYGQVIGLPADARYNDFLRLLPLGSGDVGLTGADAALEAEIEGLRDSTTNAHFWGAITCGVPDYDGCQVTVTRIIPEGAGPYPDPDPVEGWEGRYFFGAGLGEFDDCFILDFYGPFGVRYGIRGADEAQAALEDLRSTDKLTDPPPDVQIWGEVRCGVSDVNGCQITVDRLEKLFSRP